MTVPPPKTRFEITWLEDRSDDGLLAELRRVAGLMPERPLTTEAFDAQSRIGASAIGRRFGSWSEAKRRAGLVDARPEYSDDAIFSDLRRVSAEHPEIAFTHNVYAANGGRYSNSIFKRRFGGWRMALQAAGIGVRYVGPAVSDRMRQQAGRALSDDELLKEIRELAERLGKNSLTGVEIARNTAGGDLFRSRFGSVAEALRRAGVEQGKVGRRHSDEEAFRNLFETWVHYGRPPTHSEMDLPPSRVGSNTYINRYGGWRKALKSFVQRANAEADQDLTLSVVSAPEVGDAEVKGGFSDAPMQKSKLTSVTPHQRVRAPRPPPRNMDPTEMRAPSIGLRFRVFQRDQFRCKFRGRSPATESTCVLHLDHVIPFSKGGRTTLENLQVLCAECNIGKSNRSL